MPGENIIQSKQMRIVILPFEIILKLTISNVAYIPGCDSNIISLGQLQKTSIWYHNHPKYMILKQKGSVIGSAMKKKNLFILDIDIASNKAILSKKRCRPIYLLNKNL